MRYVYCILPPLLLQLIATYTVIVMNTGNGSWLGLGVFLLAIPVIPTTIAANFVVANKNTEATPLKLVFLTNLIGVLVPALIVGLFIITTLIEGLIGRIF